MNIQKRKMQDMSDIPIRLERIITILQFYIRQKKTDVYATLYKIYETVGIFFLLLIPFMFLTVYFLRIQVEEPVDELIELSKRISEGSLGTTSHKQMPNQELSYLLHSVNDMSTQLDYLFNSVYSEKLLRKDAQIMALQADRKSVV